MSTGTIEHELLDGIALDEAPPCQIFHRARIFGPPGTPRGDKITCGKPSVIRLRFSCSCGRVKTCFVCRLDWDLIRMSAANVLCDACEQPGFQWTES